MTITQLKNTLVKLGTQYKVDYKHDIMISDGASNWDWDAFLCATTEYFEDSKADGFNKIYDSFEEYCEKYDDCNLCVREDENGFPIFFNKRFVMADSVAGVYTEDISIVEDGVPIYTEEMFYHKLDHLKQDEIMCSLLSDSMYKKIKDEYGIER